MSANSVRTVNTTARPLVTKVMHCQVGLLGHRRDSDSEPLEAPNAALGSCQLACAKGTSHSAKYGPVTKLARAISQATH